MLPQVMEEVNPAEQSTGDLPCSELGHLSSKGETKINQKSLLVALNQLNDNQREKGGLELRAL